MNPIGQRSSTRGESKLRVCKRLTHTSVYQKQKAKKHHFTEGRSRVSMTIKGDCFAQLA